MHTIRTTCMIALILAVLALEPCSGFSSKRSSLRASQRASLGAGYNDCDTTVKAEDKGTKAHHTYFWGVDDCPLTNETQYKTRVHGITTYKTSAEFQSLVPSDTDITGWQYCYFNSFVHQWVSVFNPAKNIYLKLEMIFQGGDCENALTNRPDHQDDAPGSCGLKVKLVPTVTLDQQAGFCITKRTYAHLFQTQRINTVTKKQTIGQLITKLADKVGSMKKYSITSANCHDVARALVTFIDNYEVADVECYNSILFFSLCG